MNRREFLCSAAGCGVTFCLPQQLALAAGKPSDSDLATGLKAKRKVDFIDSTQSNLVTCGVCPHKCELKPKETGTCRARTNLKGTLYTRAYNNPCIIRTDPVEKVPINHFMPGTETMTVAFGGCNLVCLYCQNWKQSQKMPDKVDKFAVTPADAIKTARAKGIKTLAFNYTEPVAYLESAIEIAREARKAEMNIICATAGYIMPEPLTELAKYVDAFAIALKGFNNDYYEEVCGCKLEPVLDAIKQIRNNTNAWLEIVNLIVPTHNDDLKEIERLAKWVRINTGPDTPLHFARFVPMFRLQNLPRTSVQTLEAAQRLGRKAGLKYVYTSNIAPHDGTNTKCHKCGASLIERMGFKIMQNRITQKGRCPQCNMRIPGHWGNAAWPATAPKPQKKR